MPIYIYNSLTRKKEEFLPIKPPEVNIYTCGVTVYDESHIGHGRSLYIFDIIRRYLAYRDFKVRFIRNITDIDDKIINRANELKIDWQGLVRKYIDSYYADLKVLGVEKGDAEPRATENIPEMIKYIQGLIEKGFAYEAGGDVYFNVRKFPAYGKLSGQNIEQMESGARIDPSEHKKDPLDFALWKASKLDEPSWDSPWGNGGRPGWHIECSVMSQKFLKTDTLDIHAGGRDLIFPHHENEIAQAEALTDKPFAKYWIHHGLLTINGQKMSKSLGNFITIKNVLARYPADILKIFYLQAHYSSPIDFSWGKMDEAKKAYERIDILMRRLDREFGTRDLSKVITGGMGAIGQFKDKFIEYMDDDFNTPRALSVLFDIVNRCNIELDSNDEYKNFKLRYAMDIIKEIADIFGLTFSKEVSGEISDMKIAVAITLREQLKKEKKYSEADQIRRELEGRGIILEDTKDGTTWRRKI
ncbi:MAG: cysteine--tRNA ligase [Candidatus Omnitrophota bacterium]|jgi:cysteinyl-tRNA synthetase